MDERLLLGARLGISRRLRSAPEQETLVPRARYLPAYRRSGAQDLQQPNAFEYVLAPTAEPVHLSGEGLGQLYICFGAPGTGKSHFLMRLLEQMAHPGTSGTSWGGLLLDPKLTLIDDVKKTVSAERIHLVGPAAKSRVNLLASHLGPWDLGTALALAAQSAGISAKDPYWINAMKVLFGAGLALLQMLKSPATLGSLASLFMGTTPAPPGNPAPNLPKELLRLKCLPLTGDDARRRDRIVGALSLHVSSRGDNADTIQAFLQQILSPFLDPDLDYVSDPTAGASVSDLIIRDGRWVLLDVPRSSLAVARLLSTFTKVLFQRAVLERNTLYPHEKRRIFLVADEYAEVASDLPGEGFGDSIFFSQMRHYRVLALLATQGIPMLENSGVGEAWKTILSNSAGKFFFRVQDLDSAELAAKLCGEAETIVPGVSTSFGPGGPTTGRDQSLERRTEFTTDLFLSSLGRGEVVLIGTTDGARRAEVHCVKVPDAKSRT